MASNLQIVSAQNAPKQRRIHRRPKHPFNIRSRPFEITPFMIAPVLAGETMDNLLFQVDGLTDPIVNRQIGWHANYQFYYVPMMALAHGDHGSANLDAENIANLHIDSTAVFTSIAYASSADSAAYYNFKAGFPWLQECMQVIVSKFYRDEDDWGSGQLTPVSGLTYPLAYISQLSWIHSLKEESAGSDDTELPGVDPVEEQDILAGYTTAHDQWEIMRDSGVKDVTYQDYLRAQGVRSPGPDMSAQAAQEMYAAPEPELLRFVRKWVKPVSVIDPSDGSAVPAVKWQCAERADKKRYFKEPGFVIGVAVTTPKIYLGNQKGSIVDALVTADHWLPKVLQSFGYTSVKEVLDSVTDGPLRNQDEDYWFDVRDLFRYGDQFINWTPAAANHGLAIPDGNPLNKRFLSATEIKSLFVDTATDGANFVYQDGVVHLDVLTTVRDMTPGSGL